MKNSNWLTPALFAAAAAILRAAQMRTGFDADGLALRGNLPGALLPIVLALAAACFVATARALPSRREAAGEFADYFSFRRPASVACSVAGAFLVIVGAAALALSGGAGAGALLLAAFIAASAACVLYAVFGLYRGVGVQGVALLVPVCCLIVCLIAYYRVEAMNPVLAEIYVGILAVSALAYSAYERASFAFRNGSPRAYRVASALAFVLAVAAAAELRSLAMFMLFGGCALAELGFLAAAEF